MIASHSSPSTHAEDALLLHCARYFVCSESEGQAFRLLSDITDWAYVLRMASRHGVAPLVFHFIHETGANGFPEPFSTELQAESHENARRSLSLTAELLTLLELFDLHSIPAVAFKGPALASELYGNLALRDFCDIDILIRRGDVRRAKEVLLASGYITDLPTRPAYEAAYLRARYELHFATEDGSLIEIHQAFLAPFFSFPFDYEGLWQRLERKSFCGREILGLAPEDLLLALCAHGTKHRWSRLAWVCDIGRLLVVLGPEFDWPRITNRTSSLGARRMVMIALLLANRLLSAPVPAEVLKQAEEDVTARRMARIVERSLFAPDSRAPSDLQSHRFFLEARERVRDKFVYCASLAFMPNEEDHSAFSLPSLLSPLYYPLHAVRVLGKFGRASLKSLL
jgi:hypothetical protein